MDLKLDELQANMFAAEVYQKARFINEMKRAQALQTKMASESPEKMASESPDPLAPQLHCMLRAV